MILTVPEVAFDHLLSSRLRDLPQFGLQLLVLLRPNRHRSALLLDGLLHYLESLLHIPEVLFELVLHGGHFVVMLHDLDFDLILAAVLQKEVLHQFGCSPVLNRDHRHDVESHVRQIATLLPLRVRVRQASEVLANDSLDGSCLHVLQIFHEHHEIDFFLVVVCCLENQVALAYTNPELQQLLLSALLPLLVKSIVLYLPEYLPPLKVEFVLALPRRHDGLISNLGQLEVLLFCERDDPQLFVVVLFIIRG